MIGQRQRQHFQPAVHLARDACHGAVHLDGAGVRGLRPAQQRREHLPGLARVVVNRLLAQDHQRGLLLLHHGAQQLGHGLWRPGEVGLNQHAAIGADRQRGAQRFLGRRRAARHGDHVGRRALLLQAHGRFDGDFIERVHRHFDVTDVHAALVGLDAHVDVVVHHALARG
ncbi:hypothetical protein G6F65_019411 [Rhizopus arrhizus]|nr:hypothetical protein G6F65_019411 [Rhizopus arrhizus]